MKLGKMRAFFVAKFDLGPTRVKGLMMYQSTRGCCGLSGDN